MASDLGNPAIIQRKRETSRHKKKREHSADCILIEFSIKFTRFRRRVK